MSEAAPRTWAGTTLSARRSARRRRLLDVGLELMGTCGSGAVSVRSVCRNARLTDRYFYENFTDRRDLLLAVYDEVADEARAALVGAVAGAPDDPEAVSRAAVEGFLDVLTEDPRKGRVLLLEPMADDTVSRRGSELRPMFADLIRSQLGGPAEGLGNRLTATALVGALSTLFIDWLGGRLPVSRAQLADYCVALLTTAVSLAHRTPAHGAAESSPHAQ